MNKAQISIILIMYVSLFGFLVSKVNLNYKKVQKVDDAITYTCINSPDSNKCFDLLYPMIEDRD